MSECICTDLSCSGLEIPLGLSDIDRQIGSFADFRSALLSHISEYPELQHWHPCGQEDLGLMLLEMWAYMLDVQSFYDEIIAHETWVRTAKHRPSLRKLIELLGYVPRPAVAATATLALRATGRRAIDIPIATGFRSGAFADQAPQVFETTIAQSVHPLNSDWPLAQPVPTSLNPSSPATDQNYSSLLVDKETILKVDDLVIVSVQGAADSYRQVRTVTSVEDYQAHDGEDYKQVGFNLSINLQGGFAPQDINLWRSTQTGSLWTKAQQTGDPDAIDGKEVVLDALYSRLIAATDFVVITRSGDPRWFKVTKVENVDMTVAPAKTTTITVDGEVSSVAVPVVKAPITRLTMTDDVEISNWSSSSANLMTLYYGFERTGEVVLEALEEVSSDLPLYVDTGRRARLESPFDSEPPTQLLLQDKNLSGALVDGSVDYETAEVGLDGGESFDDLILPVTVYGNVVSVSRGESVDHEILGSGDATTANQFFKLKKAPLTYLNAATTANEQGVASTLKVYVDGILWSEVNSFYGIGADEHVYVVRQDDQGATIIHFGDGRYGARLPSGAGNVVAYYRFGAGKVAPPAQSISQLAKPVKGINSVKQVLAGNMGADAESSNDLKTLAPRSALLLGRAVSIDDIIVLASTVSGVDAAHAEWRWQATQQRPAVQIWYVGDAAPDTVLAKVLQIASPSIPIDATPVSLFPLHLSIDLELDSDYLAEEVLNEVHFLLADQESGVLVPANFGFKQSLVRSRLFADLLSVPGVLNVEGLSIQFLWFSVPWGDEIIQLPIEMMVDFISGGIELNGTEY